MAASESAIWSAVFLDRDGVINRERPDYVKSWDEFDLLPGAVSAVARLATLNIPIVVISNQSAIGRGLVSVETVDNIHRGLRRLVLAQGGDIDAFYVCPHRPDDGCACRKPAPGLLRRAALELNLDLARCVFIGDALTDYQAAMAAGCASLLVRTGRQGASLADLLLDSAECIIAANLPAAVEIVREGLGAYWNMIKAKKYGDLAGNEHTPA